MKVLLFGGNPLPNGGLDNELELLEACPTNFQIQRSPWRVFARTITIHTATLNWQFKIDHKTLTDIQLSCLREILRSKRLSGEQKISILAWMLFSMLEKIPD